MPSVRDSWIKRAVPLTVLGLSVIITGCLAGGPTELCCNAQYPDHYSNERDRCGDIAMVALDYILEPDDIRERQVRLAKIASLLGRLEHCAGIDCIRTTVDSARAADALDSLLLHWFETSGDQPVADIINPGVIICGLKHAVQAGIE